MKSVPLITRQRVCLWLSYTFTLRWLIPNQPDAIKVFSCAAIVQHSYNLVTVAAAAAVLDELRWSRAHSRGTARYPLPSLVLGAG